MKATAAEQPEAPRNVVPFRHPVPRIALREQEAAAAFGVSLGTFRTLIGEGKMPKPTYISPRIPLWDLDKLRESWAVLQDGALSEENNEWDEN